MKKQTIVWTSLPNGINGDKLRLSVFIAPQLFSDAAMPTLSLFSDWVEWTKKMATATFKIGFKDPSSAAPDTILDAQIQSTVDSNVWKAIFSPATWVKPFEHRDYPDRIFRSYPIRNIIGHVKDVYAAVALDSPTQKPSAKRLNDRFKDLCFYEIPVRQKPKTSTDFSSFNQGLTKSTQQQPDDRAYRRKPFNESRRREYYASLDQLLSAFIPRDAIKKKGGNNAEKALQQFKDRVKQDYLYLAQDPSTQLCSSASSSLRKLYNQLAEFQSVPPSEPDKTTDFLQMSLFYKPRNKVNENYLATSWLRSQQKSGSPFYYVGANKRSGADSTEKYSADRKMGSGSVKTYASDLMHQGDVNPYAFANHVTPKFDFHNIINSLTRYPWILRKLGLVIDVEVPVASVPKGSAASPCHCYVIPTWSQDAEAGVPKTNFFPRTAYSLSADMFCAAPKNPAHPEVSYGMLTVGSSDYFDVVTLEPGGSGLKMLHTVNNIQRYQARFSPLYLPEGWDLNEMHPESPDNDSSDALPALRNNGIGLSRHGLAYSIVTQLKRGQNTVDKLKTKQNFIAANNIAAANAVDATNVLYAEDITRGWRADYIDTTSDTPEWRSLMKRDGSFHFLNNAALDQTVSDEGFVSPSASQSSDGSSDDLYTGEMLFEWSGWSLVTSRPAKTLTKDEMKADGSPDLQDPNTSPVSPDGTQIKASFLPTAKTLPRLRYGHAYKLRARTVDLAGNSWDLTTAPPVSKAPNTESAAVKYLRHDVIKAPVVLLRDALTSKDGSGNTVPLSHAETVEQLVIRSNRDISTADYAAAHPPFKADTARYLTAPKVDYTFAETHGVFDKKYFDTGDWSGLYSLITQKDYQFTTAVSDGGYTCFSADPGTGDTIVIGSFKLPYLPDPLAKGIVLRGLPGTRLVSSGGSIVKHAKIILHRANGASVEKDDVDDLFPKGIVMIEFPYANNLASWLEHYPHDASIILKLVELKGGESPAPTWDSSSQTLTVRIEKSDVWRVMYSSLLEPKDLKTNFALHSWLDELPDSSSKERAMRYMEFGAHWMLTPYRNILLSHAVQQPLKDPAWYKQSLQRSFGQTTALLNDDNFLVHGKSTVKVDFNATWQLQVDDTTFDTPQDVYAEIYDASNPDMKDRKAQSGGMPVGDVPVDKRSAEIVRVKLVHDFKDTLHRLVRYEPIATTRFREYFPQTGYDFTVKGKTWDEHALSTKRPEAMKLQYIMPVFAWATENGSNSITRTRMAGLRVYMDRPWFSSGSDEKLGVVLTTAGSNPEQILGSPIAKMVTMWGYDPIWLSKPTPTELFPPGALFLTKTKDLLKSEMSKGMISKVTLDELSGSADDQQKYLVDIAVHDVFYDSERKLWYSDIMLAHGESYFPFVRLALCRVQPFSLRAGKDDVFISRVTQADFMQIMPLRKTNVNFDSTHPLEVRISVEGVSYRASNVGVLESEIEVSLEEQTPSMGSDFGWTEVSTTPIDRVNAGVLGGYWGGVIKLPKDRSATKYRLVVHEYEQFYADSFPESDTAARASSAKRTMTKIERRLVFADTIEI